MGIQSLQELVESLDNCTLSLSSFLETTKKRSSNLLLLNADNYLRYFYHENVDWLCGGQWSELFQSVERFVRAFRQLDIELVVFFDGSLNQRSLKCWASKQEIVRETSRDSIAHVTHTNNIPLRSKTKDFIPPGGLRIALRLAFRACNVLVCSSLEDTVKETVLYCKDQKCIGVLGNNAQYLIYKMPNYITVNTRWVKRLLINCKVFNINNMLTDFELEQNDLLYLATLVGSNELPDNTLSALYWSMIEDDSPLKKVQVSLYFTIIQIYSNYIQVCFR